MDTLKYKIESDTSFSRKSESGLNGNVKGVEDELLEKDNNVGHSIDTSEQNVTSVSVAENQQVKL